MLLLNISSILSVTTYQQTAFPFIGGSKSGKQRIDHYFWETEKISTYKHTRNGLIGEDYSSKLSAWLANGSLSAREIYWEIKSFEKEKKKNQSTYWLVFELIWRDFFKYISLKHGNKIFKIGGILDKNYNWNTDKKKLPAPIFHYIDGGADDEVTLRRNTSSFDDCDLIPNILASVGKPDLSTTIFGRKIDMPIFLSPTAMQRLYHPEGDKASARAAEKFGTFYSMSTMANSSIEEISNISSGPKLFQLYVHKDKSITDDLLDRCKRSGFDGMCLTVDTLVAGNREKDHTLKKTINSLEKAKDQKQIWRK